MKLTANVVRYIAGESVRRYGDLAADVPAKLQRSIRRNFRITVSREQILRMATHYKAMYAHASAILPEFLEPKKAKYVDVEDVRLDDFRDALKKAYPREPKAVREMVAWYTVHYEYLR